MPYVWSEATAREWYASAPKVHMRFLMAMMTFNLVGPKRVVEWHEGRPLPRQYAALPSRPHECLDDARRAIERHPELAPMIGYSFRPQEPSRGIAHVTTIGPDGLVVDPAAGRLGPPAGYLLVRAEPHELDQLVFPSLQRSA